MQEQIPVVINYDVLVHAFKGMTSKMSRFDSDEIHSMLRNGSYFDEITLRNVVVMGNNLHSAEFLVDGDTYVYDESLQPSSSAATTTPTRKVTTVSKPEASTASMNTGTDTPPVSNTVISDPLLPPSTVVTPITNGSGTRSSARVAAAKTDKTTRIMNIRDKRARRSVLDSGDDADAGKEEAPVQDSQRIATKPVVVDVADYELDLIDDDEVRGMILVCCTR